MSHRLLAFLLITPITVHYMIVYTTPFKEFSYSSCSSFLPTAEAVRVLAELPPPGAPAALAAALTDEVGGRIYIGLI